MNDLKNYSPEPMLLAVVGNSPNVITETLFGIMKSGSPIPKRIIALTTEVGKNSVIESDFLSDNGPLAQFCRDYKVPPIQFNQDDIKVPQLNDQPLLDARTTEEHQVLADFITHEVRKLTQATVTSLPQLLESAPNINHSVTGKAFKRMINQNMTGITGYRTFKQRTIKKREHLEYIFDKYSIHASIAGGRKSMTFLLGYAMSLFGREHDKVSHVLVDEWVEYCRDFYYPSPQPDIRMVGKPPVERDFHQAKVSLAEMPLVLMSYKMPEGLLKENRSYSETIEMFNERNVPLHMVLDVMNLKATCSQIIVNLNESQMAYLWAWTFFKNGIAPSEEAFILKVLSCYASLLSRKQQHFENEESALSYLKNTDRVSETFVVGTWEIAFALQDIAENGYIQSSKCGGMLGGKNYNKERDKLLKEFSQILGSTLAERYLPKQIDADQESTKGRKGLSIYKLEIPTKGLNIINTP
jgi:hypothetical protein